MVGNGTHAEPSNLSHGTCAAYVKRTPCHLKPISGLHSDPINLQSTFSKNGRLTLISRPFPWKLCGSG
jgi:hypothetical protein